MKQHISQGGARQRKRNRDSLVQESGQLTDNLAAISRQLASAVERSSKTVEDLAQSSTTVGDTHDEFKTMGSTIGQGGRTLSNKPCIKRGNCS